MKPGLSFAMAVAAAVLASCGSLGAFDVDLPADGEIPGLNQKLTGTQFGSYGSASGTISQTFANKGVKAGQFKSAKISAGSLSVASGMANQMAYIESFEIDVSSDGLPTVAIATAPRSAFAATPSPSSVTFTLPDVELKPYVAASSVTFTATPKFTSPPPFMTTPIHIDLTMHVQVF